MNHYAKLQHFRRNGAIPDSTDRQTHLFINKILLSVDALSLPSKGWYLWNENMERLVVGWRVEHWVLRCKAGILTLRQPDCLQFLGEHLKYLFEEDLLISRLISSGCPYFFLASYRAYVIGATKKNAYTISEVTSSTREPNNRFFCNPPSALKFLMNIMRCTSQLLGIVLSFFIVFSSAKLVTD